MRFLKNIFSIDYIENDTRLKLTILGIKIKFRPINFNIQSMLAQTSARETLISQALLDLHKETFSSYLDINDGKSVAIVGCGPTIQYYNNELNTVNIALNKALLRDNLKFDYVFAQDCNILNTCPDFLERVKKESCTKFFGKFLEPSFWLNMPEIKNAKKYNIHRYYSAAREYLPARNFGWFLHPDISRFPLADYGSVSFPALHFALFTHPDKIYFIGLDTNMGGSNFFDGGNGHYDTMKMLKGYKIFKEFAKKYYPDIEIISVNPIGLRGLFKDVYTQSFVDEHPELKNVEIIKNEGI